jgi:hypothetical protein
MVRNCHTSPAARAISAAVVALNHSLRAPNEDPQYRDVDDRHLRRRSNDLVALSEGWKQYHREHRVGAPRGGRQHKGAEDTSHRLVARPDTVSVRRSTRRRGISIQCEKAVDQKRLHSRRSSGRADDVHGKRPVLNSERWQVAPVCDSILVKS